MPGGCLWGLGHDISLLRQAIRVLDFNSVVWHFWHIFRISRQSATLGFHPIARAGLNILQNGANACQRWRILGAMFLQEQVQPLQLPQTGLGHGNQIDVIVYRR